jgi:predicted TIM-barrel fold metal-dependent hydrolase
MALVAGACILPMVATSASPARRIDVHHHFFPPDLKRAAAQYGRADVYGSSPGLAEWAPEKSLKMMESVGIRTALLSVSTPGVSFGDTVAAKTLARSCNEYGAQLRSQYPGRYGSFAVVPMPDVDASLNEIGYALDTLHADGIGILTSYGSHWLGDPLFEPIIAELDRRAAVVFVHPTVGDCCRATLAGVSPAVEEYPFDTTRAIINLIFTGTASRYPNVKYIFAHSGGATASLAPRIARLPGPAAKNMPNGVLYELRRLYFDIAIGAAKPQLAGLLALADPSHVVFGTDFPFVPTDATIPDFESYPLAWRERSAIDARNIGVLLPRLAERVA